MKRFSEGQCRTQGALLPESLDDFVSETNPVRVIDVFVDELDLRKLGFAGVDPAATGRPAYHPAALLKLYIYGYLNRIQSSRRLEREAQRNLELMWLVERLAPDFKTIANFRKDNPKGIRGVCRQFVVLCRELGLFAEAVVGIDGSKFLSGLPRPEIERAQKLRCQPSRDAARCSAKARRRFHQQAGARMSMRTGRIVAMKDTQLTVQDERTRREWKLPYSAIEIPDTGPSPAPSAPEPPAPMRADFQVGDRVSFDDRHLRTRIDIIVRINQRTVVV